MGRRSIGYRCNIVEEKTEVSYLTSTSDYYPKAEKHKLYPKRLGYSVGIYRQVGDR